MRPLTFAITAIMFAAVSVHGQSSRIPTPPPTRKQEVQDAAEKLRQAKDNIDASKATKGAAGVIDKLPSDLTDAAKSAMESKESKKEAIDALKSAAGAFLPEAQKLMKGSDATPAQPAPVPGAGADRADTPPTPAGPRPMPLQPLLEPAALIRGKATVTIDSDDAVFDLKAGIFIYRGHVRARHPQFYIECEELEVHMVIEDPDAPPKPDPIAASKPKDSGIKKAIARGPMVTIEKLSEQGEAQQAKCRRAVYEAATGEITMSDYPQVLRGNVLQVATSPSTTMVFTQKGKLTTDGPSKTDILSDSDSPGGQPGESAPILKLKGQ